MQFSKILSQFLTTVAVVATAQTRCDCDKGALDNSTFYYNITTYGTTIADIANQTKRGICDIGRANLMADVEIIPNVGQTIVVPAQVCNPDSTTCIINNYNTTRNCIDGGPRLYYTVNGDTYTKIANRLNITAASIAGNQNASELLRVGQFIKTPLCSPSQCTIQPFTLGDTGLVVYKDLAEQYGTTVGQIMMLSPTYNYTTSEFTGAGKPSITLPVNCTLTAANYTVID